MARERVGVLWAMAKHVPLTSEGHKTKRHETHHAVRFAMALGSDAAPVWGHPRQRAEPGRHPRASSEAGTRRMHVRWSPTHGYQPDQPSEMTGSGFSEARRTKTA